MLVAVMLWLPNSMNTVPEPDVATTLGQPLRLPDVQLTDQSGRSVSLSELSGNFSLMFFGFTHCPDICPVTLQVLASAQAELRSRAPDAVPEVIFISVDPYRDNPQRIRQYLSNFDPEFTGLTAPDDTLEPLLTALGVTVHKIELAGENYNIVHNGTVFVLGPEAQLLGLFGSSTHQAATIVSDYLRIRRRYSSSATL